MNFDDVKKHNDALTNMYKMRVKMAISKLNGKLSPWMVADVNFSHLKSGKRYMSVAFVDTSKTGAIVETEGRKERVYGITAGMPIDDLWPNDFELDMLIADVHNTLQIKTKIMITT